MLLCSAYPFLLADVDARPDLSNLRGARAEVVVQLVSAGKQTARLLLLRAGEELLHDCRLRLCASRDRLRGPMIHFLRQLVVQRVVLGDVRRRAHLLLTVLDCELVLLSLDDSNGGVLALVGVLLDRGALVHSRHRLPRFCTSELKLVESRRLASLCLKIHVVGYIVTFTLAPLIIVDHHLLVAVPLQVDSAAFLRVGSVCIAHHIRQAQELSLLHVSQAACLNQRAPTARNKRLDRLQLTQASSLALVLRRQLSALKIFATRVVRRELGHR